MGRFYPTYYYYQTKHPRDPFSKATFLIFNSFFVKGKQPTNRKRRKFPRKRNPKFPNQIKTKTKTVWKVREFKGKENRRRFTEEGTNQSSWEFGASLFILNIPGLYWFGDLSFICHAFSYILRRRLPD